MISVQQAVTATLDYVKNFQDIMPSSSIRLEEFDFDENNETWLITLSFADQQLSPLVAPNRSFKTFSVNASDGSVYSMKIRNPLAPMK